MTPERWAQIRQILEGALERPDKDRAPYLRVVCAGDDVLRKEVESLLASHDDATEFLNRPAADVRNLPSGTMFAGSGSMSSYTLPSGTMPGFDDDAREYPPGFRAGPYQLQKRIGRGGMGSVWLANRVDQAFEMNVAVKLVKRGMDTQEILRRFRLERQLLAGLDHPNIAHLIDGGSTVEGLPYLVMEYVEGIPIDQFCESRKLAITDRLKLFRQVCSAVQYAHQNLVVHRDIKMGNILVTAEGMPKLLDFGIAKLMRSEFSTLAAAETRPEMRPMTLDYASPEQVKGEQITTATDVYSLGVLLYKLLTGKFPYGPEHRSNAALQKAICETEPLKPSSVILTDDKVAIPQATQKIEAGVPGVRPSTEESRSKARHRLKKKLAGDLDTIILKALRKEPAKRYGSAEQFSEDVRRYLEGRPVAARSDTFGYRTGKFVRRNLGAVAAVAAVFAALIAGAVTSASYAREAYRQRALSELQYQAAQADAVRQHQELMEAYSALGQISLDQKNTAAALSSYRSGLEAARRFTQAHPSLPVGHKDVAQAAIRVAKVAPEAEAMELYQEALRQIEISGGAIPPVEKLRLEAEALGGLGTAQLRGGDLLAALASFSRALQTTEFRAGMLPQDAEAQRRVAQGNFSVGTVLSRNHAPEAALAKFRKALDILRGLGLPTPTVKEQTPEAYEQALANLGLL